MITKNYIKMCEKAREIKEFWKPGIEANSYYRKERKGIDLFLPHQQTWLYTMKKRHCIEAYQDYIWLPTQEQLQEMVFPDNWIPRECMSIMRKFQFFYEQTCDAFTSWNELWLAFVMHEKYHKIWNGREWKEVEEQVKKIPEQQKLKL